MRVYDLLSEFYQRDIVEIKKFASGKIIYKGKIMNVPLFYGARELVSAKVKNDKLVILVDEI